MKIEAKEHDTGITEVALSGRLDIAGVGEIETQFAAYANKDKAALLVDMSDVEFMSSIGIRLLLVNAKAVRLRGGKLVLLNPQEGVRQVLDMSGVVTLVAVYDDRSEAAEDLLAVIN
jgi:anti-anti-sigma factor